MNTIANRIRDGLQNITNQLVNLIKNIPIEKQNCSIGIGETVIPRFTFYWGERTPEQTYIQIDLKKEYDTISAIMNVIFIKAPRNVLSKLKQADGRFRGWLEFNSSISNDCAENEKQLRKCAGELEQFLNILEAKKCDDLILIPDTNALLTSVEPVDYRKVAGQDNFVFLLLPTVLGELDRLKNNHSVQTVRDKSKDIIKRIKGWRKQGSLLTGVTIDKTITVRAITNESDMKLTLPWLNKDNADDRILASILEIQVNHPTSNVILVTGDINLQNKAELAMIVFKEVEELSS